MRKKQTKSPADEQVIDVKTKPVKPAKAAKPAKSKKVSVNAASVIANKIPYLRCFEEHGMFEIEHNKYSVTYAIHHPQSISDEQYIRSAVYSCMEKILVTLKDFTFRFTIRNSNISAEEYLDSILLPENREDNVNKIIRDYNNVLRENMDIGHNNFKMTLYLTLITDAEVPDDALARFEAVDDVLIKEFHEMYGYLVHPLTLAERLEVLYEIYHPDANAPAFGSKVDYDGKGFSIASMQRMKMNTKDVIAPSVYRVNEKDKDYFRIGNKFVRALFINSIPMNVNDSLLPDLISISSNSMLSVTYQPIDAAFGFKASAKLVKDNIEVRNIAVQDTIEDRKNHRTMRQETMLRESEDEYFYKSALKVFTDSAAKDHPMILATFVIVLFADTLDDLARDTTLLKLSASKYACHIKAFDLQQHEAFVSALPLGSMRVNTPRIFDIDRLSRLLPVSVQSLFEREVTLQGLNGINDNFVLIDRKNYILGLITGMPTSGKTFAMKRDIVNTLMTSDDMVVVITNKKNNGYESLTEQMGGQRLEPVLTDLFSADTDYGLMDEKKTFKKMFLEAFLTLSLGFHKKRYTPDELQTIYDEVDKEAEALCEYDDYVAAVTYAREHGSEFKLFNKAVMTYVPTDTYPDMDAARLHLMYYTTPAELLLQVDYIWNCAIMAKKNNKNLWIYVDGADEFLYSPATSDYFMSLLDKCKALKVPFTMVLQDCAKIVSNDTAKIEFDYLLERIEYFKLLTQGIIERRKFIEKLDIPQTLVPYISDAEPGEGIIITPSQNVSFNDRFEAEDNPFYGKIAETV